MERRQASALCILRCIKHGDRKRDGCYPLRSASSGVVICNAKR